MPLIKLLKTTAFRLAVLYLALFAVSAAAVLAYVYWNTAGFLVSQTDEAVQSEITGLAEQYAQGGLPLLVSTVIQRSRDPDQSLYLVLDPRGQMLAGNLTSRPSVEPGSDGWIDFRYNRKTADGEIEVKAARARAFLLPEGFYLLVGRDIQERKGVEHIITGSLVWAVALTIGLGLIGGLLMSRNMLARVDAINRISRDIMQGELGRRLPVAGTGDELDQLELNLNAMLDQIEKLMTGMRQVTDNVAHDLRSPLSRLRNRLEVSLMEDLSRDEYRLVLERTIGEADQLLRTFNALLMIARAEAGSVREAMSNIDISDIVRDVAELYEPLVEERGFGMRISVAEGLSIRGNRELLFLALSNMSDNALKHGAPAGAEGEAVVEVGAALIGGQVCICVGDHGEGVPENERERVLDRFVRLEASRNTPGSGLGLSLVAAAARLHGGRVELSDNQPGLRVSLFFPVVAA